MGRQYTVFRKKENIFHTRNKTQLTTKIFKYFDFDTNKPTIVADLIMDNSTLSWMINNRLTKKKALKNLDRLIALLSTIREKIAELDHT